MENNNSAPTGCYKCGRPGHWSRDCPSSAHLETSSSKFADSRPAAAASGAPKSLPEKPKKVPRKRPKLTPDLLLSDDGLGYVLRYFPRSFKYRGRGNEVSDLGNLISLYGEWHSHLLPSFSFEQFVHKVEQVAASKRVKICIGELKERVARGGDPTKLHEQPDEHVNVDKEQGAEHSKEPNSEHDQGDPFADMNNADNEDPFADLNNADNGEESMLQEIYEKVTEEPSQYTGGSANAHNEIPVSISGTESADKQPNNGAGDSSEAGISELQRARMEANKLKALERVSTSSSAKAQLTEEQKARMEANRLKALERAAARAGSSKE